GDGSFKAPSTYLSDSNPFAQTAGDLNHDRYPDLVMVDYNAQTIQVLLNDGSWTAPIPPPATVRSASLPSDEASSVRALTSRSRIVRASDSIDSIEIAPSFAETHTVSARRAAIAEEWVHELFPARVLVDFGV